MRTVDDLVRAVGRTLLDVGALFLVVPFIAVLLVVPRPDSWAQLRTTARAPNRSDSAG